MSWGYKLQSQRRLYISQPWYQCGMQGSWSTRVSASFLLDVGNDPHELWSLWGMATCFWTAGGFQVHIGWFNQFNLQRRNWRSHTFPLTLKRKPSRKVLECGSIMVFLFFSGSSLIFPGSFWLFTILCISWVSSFTLCTASGGGFSFLPQVRWADVDFLECFPAVFPAVVLLFICLWICLF